MCVHDLDLMLVYHYVYVYMVRVEYLEDVSRTGRMVPKAWDSMILLDSLHDWVCVIFTFCRQFVDTSATR